MPYIYIYIYIHIIIILIINNPSHLPFRKTYFNSLDFVNFPTRDESIFLMQYP
jgi:hypothetical protein